MSIVDYHFYYFSSGSRLLAFACAGVWIENSMCPALVKGLGFQSKQECTVLRSFFLWVSSVFAFFCETLKTSFFIYFGLEALDKLGFHCEIFVIFQPLSNIIIQHIDTLPKYGKKTLDVRRSTWRLSNDRCKFQHFDRECKNKKLFDNIFSSIFVLLSMCWINRLILANSAFGLVG